MAKVNLTTIKNWFKTGLKPTQIQFWDTWDSFFHKDDMIPIAQVEGINNVYSAINAHVNDPNAHAGLLATSRIYPFPVKQRFKGLGNTNNAIWQAGDIGIGYLPDGSFLDGCFFVGNDMNDFNPDLNLPENWYGDIKEPFANN
jgi:glutathionyl-hydroquinone reductase